MGATFSRVKNWVAEILTYADLNAEFNNILTNLTPAGMDDASANAGAMQATTDPYPASTESLPTSLEGELQRIRYVIAQITGETYWYQDPDSTIAALFSGQLSPWVAVTAFTATPASTSTITMTSDLTATLLVGTPLKYTIGGTAYYGIVTAITSNLLTIAGAPLSGDVTALYYGDAARVNQLNVIIPGLYEDASNTDLIGSDLASKLIWNKGKAYCVRYKVYSAVHDSGTHGQASVQINNTEVNTTAGGLTIAADATWYSTVVDIAIAAYDVNPGEEVEVTALNNTGTGDASDLTVEMTFVFP